MAVMRVMKRFERPLQQNVCSPVELLLFLCRTAEEGMDADSAHTVRSVLYVHLLGAPLPRYKVPVIEPCHNVSLSEKLFMLWLSEQVEELCFSLFDLHFAAFITRRPTLAACKESFHDLWIHKITYNNRCYVTLRPLLLTLALG